MYIAILANQPLSVIQRIELIDALIESRPAAPAPWWKFKNIDAQVGSLPILVLLF